ncbi:S1C family serine protease [Luteitalea sp.]
MLMFAAAPQGQERIAYDYSAMYEAINPSVVKVHADAGTGSGFLVNEAGFIATNHHVVRNARFIAVEYPDGRKVPAEIVVLDARHDVAVLKVNTATTTGVRPLPLLSAENDDSVRPGIPVVAFGSPRSQTFLMTQGIVAKVEPGVLLGDFLIQEGNSGGPLVNLQGQVIGINTFGEGRVSGAVRVGKLRDVLAKSAVTDYAGEEPSATELPTADRERYPTDMLRGKIVEEAFEAEAYKLDGGRFTITAVTPVLVGRLQVYDDMQQAANRYKRRGKKIKDESFDPVDEPFYEWYRNASSLLDSVVTFEVKPDFGQTAGSMWMSALAGAAAGLSRTYVAPTRQSYEFKAEFQDLRLYRDGKLMAPIHPGRQITEQSMESYWMTFVDEAYSGWYSYHPSVFMTGKQFRLEVYDARDPGKVHKSIMLEGSSKLIQQIRRDFNFLNPAVAKTK